MSIALTDVLFYGGGQCLQRFGTLSWRSTIDQDRGSREVFARAGVAPGIARDGSVRYAGANVPALEWVDSDGDGDRDLATLLVRRARYPLGWAKPNLAGEYALAVRKGQTPPSVVLPANHDPDSWQWDAWIVPDWDEDDGADHVFVEFYLSANDRVQIYKAADNSLQAYAVAGGVPATVTLSKTIAAGTAFNVGVRVYGGTLYLYADVDSDGSLTDDVDSVAVGGFTAGTYTQYIGVSQAGSDYLDGYINAVLTNDGSDASAITDRFSAGAGMALGGDMGWLARVSGNGSRHGENLVLHVGGNADGTAYQLDTAHNALDLFAGTATGRVDLPATTGYARFGNTAEFDAATKLSLMWEVEFDATGSDAPLFLTDSAGIGSSSLAITVHNGGAAYAYFGSGADEIDQTCTPGHGAGQRMAIGIAIDLGLAGTARAKFYYALRAAGTRKYGAWTEYEGTKNTSGTIPASLAAETGIHQIGGLTFDGKFDTFAWKIGTAHDFTTFDAADIIEPDPTKWDHAWTFDGSGADSVGALTATVTGGSYVDDGRHHLGRFERWAAGVPDGWTDDGVGAVGQGTASADVAEGTWSLHLTGSAANQSVSKVTAALTVDRHVLLVGQAREAVAGATVSLAGSAFASQADASLPTQASMADVGVAARVVTAAAGTIRCVVGNTAEAYFDNLRALQLATVSPAAGLDGGDDVCYFPWPYSPGIGAFTIVVDMDELGTLLGAGGVLHIGAADATSGARVTLESTGSYYRLTHSNGSVSAVATLAAAPSHGQRNRLRAVINADGSVLLGQTIGSGSETTAADATTVAVGSSYAAARLYVGCAGTTKGGDARIRAVRAARGVRTLAEVEAVFA